MIDLAFAMTLFSLALFPLAYIVGWKHGRAERPVLPPRDPDNFDISTAYFQKRKEATEHSL